MVNRAGTILCFINKCGLVGMRNKIIMLTKFDYDNYYILVGLINGLYTAVNYNLREI